MNKMLLMLTVTLILTSCSGYFDADNSGGNQAQTLVISTGGYLSSDSFNEESPFLLRNFDNSGDPTLFFASDKNGSFDIYFARMNSQGEFYDVTYMETNINNSYSQKFPIAFWDISTVTNLWLSYIERVGNSYFLVTSKLDPVTLSFVTNIQYELTSYQISGMGYRYGLSELTGLGHMYLYYSTNEIRQLYSFSTLMGWDLVSTPAFQYFDFIVFSGNSRYEQYNQESANYYILETSTNGTQFWFTYLDWQSTAYSSSLRINAPVEYNSGYIDKHPFVDYYGKETKVYFSSLREGTFDLYRYNVATFGSMVDYPIATVIQNWTN